MFIFGKLIPYLSFDSNMELELDWSEHCLQCPADVIIRLLLKF